MSYEKIDRHFENFVINFNSSLSFVCAIRIGELVLGETRFERILYGFHTSFLITKIEYC